MSDLSSCNNIVPNCDINTITIGNSCVPFTITNTPIYSEFIGQSNDLNQPVISSSTTTNLYECLYKCSQNNDCDAISYSYKDSMCNLLSKGETGEISETEEFSGTNPRSENSNCVDFYKKKSQQTSDGFSIKINDNKYININPNNGVIVPSIQKIQGNHIGVGCRQDVVTQELDPTQYKDILQGLQTWCQKNPDKKVCKQFCSNPSYSDYCPGKNQTPLYIFLSLFFILLIIFIILIVKGKKIAYFIIGIFDLIFFGLSIWQLFIFIQTKGKYEGNQSDYKPNTIPGIKPICACPDWMIKVGDNCYQPPPNGIGWNSLACNHGHTGLISTCSGQYRGGPLQQYTCPGGKVPPPYCNPKPLTVPKGSYYCAGSKININPPSIIPPAWKVCEDENGCNIMHENYFSPDAPPFNQNPSGSGNIAYCSWPPE